MSAASRFLKWLGQRSVLSVMIFAGGIQAALLAAFAIFYGPVLQRLVALFLVYAWWIVGFVAVGVTGLRWVVLRRRTEVEATWWLMGYVWWGSVTSFGALLLLAASIIAWLIDAPERSALIQALIALIGASTLILFLKEILIDIYVLKRHWVRDPAQP